MNNQTLNLNQSQRILLNLLEKNLFNINSEVTTDETLLKYVWKEAYFQAVSLPAFSNYKFEKYSNKDLNYIKAEMGSMLVYSVKMASAHTQIHSILSSAGIPYTIIKGLASALYYPDPIMRTTGDVDFLVKPEDLPEADKVLKKHGFKQTKDFHDCHLVYTYGDCRYEMHFEPAGIPEGSAGDLIRKLLSDTVDNAHSVKTEVGEIFVPSDFHHGLIILLHSCHHLCGSGLGLRHLCDWAVFISRFSKAEFSLLFEDKLKQIGLWKFLCVLSNICVRYLGCDGSLLFDGDEAIEDAILKDILNGGNLGQKNHDRSHEQLVSSVENESSINAFSMLKMLFKSANRIVYSNWKLSRKLKIILPFGWLFFGIRYLLRSLTGKRPPIRPKKIVKEVKSRGDLFSQLNLFISNNER